MTTLFIHFGKAQDKNAKIHPISHTNLLEEEESFSMKIGMTSMYFPPGH
jgi:hypothetical protein